MSLAATATRVIDRVGGHYSDLVGRIRLAAEDVVDARPIDHAIATIQGLLDAQRRTTHPHSDDDPDPGADALVSRIGELEREVVLLRQRDRLLSQHMGKMDEEARLAARIQQDFLPKQMPVIGRVRFAALYRPASYVSGDLYDVARLDERHVGVYIADAVGHGMPAALLTMFMRNALHTKQITPDGYRLLEPHETLADLNSALRGQNLTHASFATAVYARVDCESAEVRFARGGHPNPLVIRADGSLEEATADGSLLGIFDEPDWATAGVQLGRGDRLMFYTDGVEVAFAPAADGTVDAGRWRREMAELTGRSTVDILAHFGRAIEEQVGHGVPKDDLTIVIAEVQ